MFKIIIADNEVEFSNLSSKLQEYDIKAYFVYPYSFWKQSTNERHNRIIRWFVSRGKSLKISLQQLLKQNNRRLNEQVARKILECVAPEACFDKELLILGIQ